MTDYKILCESLKSIIEDIPYTVSNLANASALIYNSLENINWAGFYLLEDKNLVLGPFQGKPACILIPEGKGVCGTVLKNGKMIVVDDVQTFEGHIACDSNSKSEIVIPLYKDKKIIGVLDIDSPVYKRFQDFDIEGLKNFVKILEKNI